MGGQRNSAEWILYRQGFYFGKVWGNTAAKNQEASLLEYVY